MSPQVMYLLYNIAGDLSIGKTFDPEEPNTNSRHFSVADCQESTFCLVRNVELQRKLTNELVSIFLSFDETRAGTKLRLCQYLTAFIQEGLRMAPAVGADLDRKVLDSDFKVDGHYFPQGYSISSAYRPICYNTGYYPGPYKFRPERCLPGSSSQSVSLAGSSLCAFFTGHRECAGKHPALLEMSIFLAKVMRRFELKQEPEINFGGGSRDGEWGCRRRVDQN